MAKKAAVMYQINEWLSHPPMDELFLALSRGEQV